MSELQPDKTDTEDVQHLEKASSHEVCFPGDEERLAQMGHAQELTRRFSPFALGALCLCLMATWEALSTVIAAALVSGGPPCLFYNYVLSLTGTVCIALSLGEIASRYPTAGGQYHWVAALCPPSTRSLAAWITGWISIGAQTVLTASAAFAAGLQAQSLIILNHDDYAPTRWQGMPFYWAVLAYAAAVNIWGIKLMPHINLVSGIIHIAAFVAIITVLGVMAPKHSSEFVFAEAVNSSGWGSDAISWLVGLQSAVYPLLGYDAACHLAEELPNASRNVPVAMVGSVVLNGLIGLVYSIILLFSAGSLESLLETPTGFPFMQIYLDVTKSRAGATVMSLMPVIIAMAATIAGLASTSRTLWAFARDKATPFDSYLSTVSKTHRVPLNAVAVNVGLQFLLGLLYLGNETAFNAVLSMAIIGIYLSYGLPIAYMISYGRPGTRGQADGRFRLRRGVGVALNVVGLIWIIVAVIFSTFPLQMPVTPQNMNYSTVVLSGWILFGIAYYFALGRQKFEVPVMDVNT